MCIFIYILLVVAHDLNHVLNNYSHASQNCKFTYFISTCVRRCTSCHARHFSSSTRRLTTHQQLCWSFSWPKNSTRPSIKPFEFLMCKKEIRVIFCWLRWPGGPPGPKFVRAPRPSAEGTRTESRIEVGRPLQRYGGMPPQQMLKSRVSEMPFPALWGKILQNSDGQKTAYNMSKFRNLFRNLQFV